MANTQTLEASVGGTLVESGTAVQTREPAGEPAKELCATRLYCKADCPYADKLIPAKDVKHYGAGPVCTVGFEAWRATED